MLGRNSSEGSEVPALLPRAAGAPSLEALKAGLDGTLGSLNWGVQPAHSRVWGWWTLGSPLTQALLQFILCD